LRPINPPNCAIQRTACPTVGGCLGGTVQRESELCRSTNQHH